MEVKELEYLNTYGGRLHEHYGDPGSLTVDERKHLRMLMGKYELEIKLRALEAELYQLKLPGMGG